MSDGVLRRLAVLAAGAAVLAGLAAAWLVLGWPGDVSAYDSARSDIVVGTLFPLAGLLVVQRQPRNGAGWVLLSAGLIAVSALSHQWAWMHHQLGGEALPGGTVVRGVAVWLASWTFVPYFLQPTLLPLLFPGGRAPSPKWERFGRLVLGLTILAAFAAAVRPDGNVEDLGFANPLGVGGPGFANVTIAVTIGVAMFCFLVAGPICIGSLVARTRRAAGQVRAQLSWLLLGFLLYLALVIGGELAGLGDGPREVLFMLGFVAIPTCIAVAVVRHGFLDVDFVLNRTVTYLGLTLLAFAVYGVGITAFGRWVGAREAAPLAAAAAAFIAALIREQVQSAVGRWLFGQRSDPVAVLDRIGASVALSHPSLGLEALVTTLADSLRLPFVAVVPEDGRPPLEVGRPVGEVEELPILVGGRQAAVLRVGHRHTGERFRPQEEVAFGDAARRAASVLQAADLTSQLQRSRERIIAAREEERRRLRHDLHDGVGPSLAGMALQLDGLARRLDADAPELAARAVGLRTTLADLVVEVRRIVDGLRPAPVAELGLAEALRQIATDEGPPMVLVEVAGPLPALPAAIEVAAYRIVAEAVANAIRHAAASECRVSVQVEHDELAIVVIDDGHGFEAPTVEGVGMTSMVERAAEIGGRLLIRSAVGDGVAVEARLPLVLA